jgi:hypothetical protein
MWKMKKYLVSFLFLLAAPTMTFAATPDKEPVSRLDAVTTIFESIQENFNDGYNEWVGQLKGPDTLTYTFDGKTFKDIDHVLQTNTATQPKEWYTNTYQPYARLNDYLAVLTGYGIISGNPDGNFYPEKPITRGQLAKIINGVYNFPSVKQIMPLTDTGHTDYTMGIHNLYAFGIMKGVSATKFAPNEYVTNEQLSIIVKRLKAFTEEKETSYAKITPVKPLLFSEGSEDDYLVKVTEELAPSLGLTKEDVAVNTYYYLESYSGYPIAKKLVGSNYEDGTLTLTLAMHYPNLIQNFMLAYPAVVQLYGYLIQIDNELDVKSISIQ